MTDRPNHLCAETGPSDPADHLVERVQELSWALVDEQIATDEFRLLENLLLSSDKARGAYLDCVQLHADLMDHYRAKAPASVAAAAPAKSPVLGFLNAGLPPTAFESPHADDIQP